MEKKIRSLEERAKELSSLYQIEALLNTEPKNDEEVFPGIAKAISEGMQYPELCSVRILIYDRMFDLPGFHESDWFIEKKIKYQNEIVGSIYVSYSNNDMITSDPVFLDEEVKLISTVSDRIGHYLFQQKMEKFLDDFENETYISTDRQKPEWTVILEMLHKTDQHLFSVISRKMLNILFFRGVEGSAKLLQKIGSISAGSLAAEQNRPSKKSVLENSFTLGFEIFRNASGYLTDDEILAYIQKWIHEDKSGFLLKSLSNMNTPLSEIADDIRRYYYIMPPNEGDSPIDKGIRVSLIRRFLTDQLQFINIAKMYCYVIDFYYMIQRMIFPSESHGKLGGKSSGIFLAHNILKRIEEHSDIYDNLKTPKTWYITSDGLMNFIYFNNLEDVAEQKYKDFDQVRQEYPLLVQVFKNSHFPPEMINGLSRALDDFGVHPIIVRSSSLLEDRIGTAFAGKYKSLFLANQGDKKSRLDALLDAIAEVYASTFGPDPIGYRHEKNLLDFNEEMGIMIQEVVGKQVGNYFFPAFAGVAFSNNEFRWSARIKREDGLLRIVPGLGTRAVDRIGDDYPILIAPGQPDLRINLSYDEIIGYSPHNIDVINLEKNSFETIPIKKLISEIGDKYPMLNEVFSIYEDKHVHKPVGLGIDTRKHDIVVTFENLFANTGFIKMIHTILHDLAEKLDTPIDIEFACDGDSLYLLQSRPQSYSFDSISAVIPKDMPKDRVIFSANKYISNGRIPDITHIVYVDPDNYTALSGIDDLKSVGRAISQLNTILPHKRFILMGPGRWGSRDDIRLGVKVTYSDINNSAMLVEIARNKGNYTPDLSFGTHFFQDLVESSIRYLPLYPDEDGNVFNFDFFNNSENMLPALVPEFAALKDTIKVIDVPATYNGMLFRVLMNADQGEAVGILTDPDVLPVFNAVSAANIVKLHEDPWLWRKRMVQTLASNLDSQRFGVKALWVYTDSVSETTGPQADIDLVVHFDGSKDQMVLLQAWLDGWNQCLSAANYEKTGFLVSRILDVKFITTDDLKNKTGLVQKISSFSDFVLPLKIR